MHHVLLPFLQPNYWPLATNTHFFKMNLCSSLTEKKWVTVYNKAASKEKTLFTFPLPPDRFKVILKIYGMLSGFIHIPCFLGMTFSHKHTQGAEMKQWPKCFDLWTWGTSWACSCHIKNENELGCLNLGLRDGCLHHKRATHFIALVRLCSRESHHCTCVELKIEKQHQGKFRCYH